MIIEVVVFALLCVAFLLVLVKKILCAEIKVNEADIIDKLETVHEHIFGNLMLQISKQIQQNFNSKNFERQDNKFVYNKIKLNTMKVDIINCFDSDLPLTFYQKTIFRQDIQKVQNIRQSSVSLLWFFLKSYIFRYHYLFGLLSARSQSDENVYFLHIQQMLLFAVCTLFTNLVCRRVVYNKEESFRDNGFSSLLKASLIFNSSVITVFTLCVTRFMHMKISQREQIKALFDVDHVGLSSQSLNRSARKNSSIIQG